MSPGLTAQPSAAPCAARQVNAFTVDVEDYFHVAALSSVITRDSWATREYRVEANTERLLALLAERQVHGTFFVLGWVAGRSPGLVRRIAQAGHEVACPGFSPPLVFRESPAEFRAGATPPKKRLEGIIGEGVLGDPG